MTNVFPACSYIQHIVQHYVPFITDIELVLMRTMQRNELVLTHTMQDISIKTHALTFCILHESAAHERVLSSQTSFFSGNQVFPTSRNAIQREWNI